jgi:hypothetical protein
LPECLTGFFERACDYGVPAFHLTAGRLTDDLSRALGHRRYIRVQSLYQVDVLHLLPQLHGQITILEALAHELPRSRTSGAAYI